MFIVVPLCLGLSSCSRSSASQACESFGKSLGEVAAKASGRVVKSAKEVKDSTDPGWDPETEKLPPGMKAVHPHK
jgi:hypothetical protein